MIPCGYPRDCQGEEHESFFATPVSAPAVCAALAVSPAGAQQPATFKLGIVTFLSGAAAGPFGVPARNAAELTIEALNAGKLPAPYDKKGINGMSIEMVIVDEAGGTTKQVTEYRNLVERQNVDAVIGYISSGDCLAIAPLADELKELTIFFDCGTPRIFEDSELQVSVPHRRARHHGQRRGRPLPARARQEHQDHCRHQSELRLGAGFLDRLQAVDAGAQP